MIIKISNKIALKFLLPLVILSITGNVFAQQLVKKNTKVQYLPKLYDTPDGSILPAAGQDIDQMYWIVYSDRQENKSYVSADGETVQSSEIPFLKSFFVIGETAEYLHVAEYSPMAWSDLLTNHFLSNVKDYGWMKKDNLLLWNSCLYAKGGIAIKALAVVTDASVLKNPKKYMQSDGSIKVFKDPSTDEGSLDEGKQIKLAQFLFIFKENEADGTYLVGRTYQVGRDVKDIIQGWVSKKTIQKWADRVCIEPDWNADVAEERKNQNVKASLFQNPNDANAYYSKQQPSKDPIWNDDPYDNRWDGQRKRFPVLSDDFFQNPNAPLLTGYVTDILDGSSKVAVKVNDQAKVEKGANKQNENIGKINLVFVIDGSPEAANDYRKYINQTISNFATGINTNSSGEDKNNISIKFGAVVYRDASQQNFAMESMAGLASDINDLTGFIDTKLGANVSTTDNDPKHQALYKGLDGGLRLFDQNSKGQTNFLIIIGNQGDNPSAPSADELAIEKMAVDRNAEFIVIQPRGGERSFPSQLRTIAVNVSKTILSNDINKNVESKRAKAKDMQLGDPEMLSKDQSNYTIFYLQTPEKSPIYTYITEPEAGATLTQEDMREILDSNLYSAIEIIQKEISQINDRYSGIGEKNQVKLNARLVRMLADENFDVDPSTLAEFGSDSNFQFFVQGYCKLNMNGLKDPVFKPVVLMTEAEYVALLNKLEAFQLTSNGKKLREDIKNAFIQELEDYYGKENKSKIKEMSHQSLDKITELITRLPAKDGSILKKYSLDMLSSEAKVKDAELEDIAAELEKDLTRLNNAKRNNKTLRMEYNGDTYYWISQEDLP